MTDSENGSPRQSGFRLGRWQVSPAQNLICDDNGEVRLEPRAMEVLVYLASRQGEVVSRAELEAEVWRGGLVGYDAVTSTIIKLRKALGDSARQPSYIATIPKRGYQLIGRVTWPQAPAAADEGGDTIAPTPPRQDTRARAAAWTLTVLAATVATVLVIWITVDRTDVTHPVAPPATDTGPTTQRTSVPSLAVLPFENLSEDPLQARFADGMTEDLITDLSGIANLQVIASNTAFAYKGRKVGPREVGEALDVGFVLEGSVRRHGDALRINARLVNAQTAFQVWAARYDRTTRETFAVQDELTAAIVDALAIQLSSGEERRLARQPTSNLDAYDHFQEGQRLSKINTPQSNRDAQAAYRRAIDADPAYGRAYGALAYTMAYSYRRGWSDSPMQTIDRALELARIAVELDASIPQTHWALGYVLLMRKAFEQASAAVQRALDIAPNYADGYGLLALIKNGLGEAEEAIGLIRRGMKLNPYYTWDYPYNLGRAYYLQKRYDEAIDALEAARTRNPNVIPIRLTLAASYVGAGRMDDAEWEIQEMQAISPGETLSHVAGTHPTSDPARLGILLDDLRRAGLPE